MEGRVVPLGVLIVLVIALVCATLVRNAPAQLRLSPCGPTDTSHASMATLDSGGRL